MIVFFKNQVGEISESDGRLMPGLEPAFEGRILVNHSNCFGEYSAFLLQ